MVVVVLLLLLLLLLLRGQGSGLWQRYLSGHAQTTRTAAATGRSHLLCERVTFPFYSATTTTTMTTTAAAAMTSMAALVAIVAAGRPRRGRRI